jgi:hypothetical protein
VSYIAKNWLSGADMTPEQKDEFALKDTTRFLSGQIEYSKQNNLEVYPPSYICKNRDYLTSEAKLGNPYFRDILFDFASCLTTYGKPLPLWLQDYVVWAAKHGGRSRRQRGRDPYATEHRNQTIASAVLALVEDYGYRPTRNTATTTECGCSIVAKALEDIGIHMSEGNVVAIWWAFDKRYSHPNSSRPEEKVVGCREASAGCSCALFDCEDLKHFGPHFDLRMAALGHLELISRALTGAIDLRELVKSEFKDHTPRECITIRGPAVCLHQMAAETIALALSELNNYAVLMRTDEKSQARVNVEWQTTCGALVLEWRKSGAKNVPTVAGYIKELIEFALPFTSGMRTQLAFGRRETYCRIELRNYESRC